jgi:hypothetical protein
MYVASLQLSFVSVKTRDPADIYASHEICGVIPEASEPQDNLASIHVTYPVALGTFTFYHFHHQVHYNCLNRTKSLNTYRPSTIPNHTIPRHHPIQQPKWTKPRSSSRCRVNSSRTADNSLLDVASVCESPYLAVPPSTVTTPPRPARAAYGTRAKERWRAACRKT